MPVTRVAIVGGGFAGIAAAWSLSQQKDFQVDIYEKSWRLGGKTASARADGGYIVDNSLGVWLGFYENAFRMMRQCYAEVERCKWGPDANAGDVLLFGRMEDAFFPEPNVGAWGRNPKTSEGQEFFPRLGRLVGLFSASQWAARRADGRGFESVHAQKLPFSLLRIAEDSDAERHPSAG